MDTGTPFESHILHVDGDGFFAGCEVARRPDLVGKPVVTGRERGIITSATYEAKALGITRAMPVHEIKRNFPQVTILPSDYELYAMVSKRMYAIVRRQTPDVEEYGVDECFADLTHLKNPLEAARTIKDELQRELNMTFSVGVSSTKVLAKVGSKHEKPNGFTILTPERIPEVLMSTSASAVWGIGHQTTKALLLLEVETAYEFAQKDEAWIRLHFNKPILELWHELNGRTALVFDSENASDQKSVQRTRSFNPPTTDPRILFSELSQHTEHACRKLRRMGLVATHATFFLKTQGFRFHWRDVPLSVATNSPQEIVSRIREGFLATYRTRTPYRATGITLQGLRPVHATQQDLFDTELKHIRTERVTRAMDRIDEKYGEHTLYLGTSSKSVLRDRARVHSSPLHEHALIKTPLGMKRFSIPYLGEV